MTGDLPGSDLVELVSLMLEHPPDLRLLTAMVNAADVATLRLAAMLSAALRGAADSTGHSCGGACLWRPALLAGAGE